MGDEQRVIAYLRHYAKVKSWPRLDECADVFERLLAQHDRDAEQDAALDRAYQARDDWKYEAERLKDELARLRSELRKLPYFHKLPPTILRLAAVTREEDK